MNLAIKAILARCNQDKQAAFAYCHRMASQSKNPHLRQEYRELAKHFWDEAGQKAEAAHI